MERVFVSPPSVLSRGYPETAAEVVAVLTQKRLRSVLIGNGRSRSLPHVQETNRQMLVVYAAAVLAVALIGARYLKSAAGEKRAGATGQIALRGTSGTSGASGRSDSSGRSELVVYVSGAVRRPGIVRLADGDRIADAIDAAGGELRSADLGAVNLAARLSDGQQVVVPRRATVGPPAAAAPGQAGAAPGAGLASGPVSLSSATIEQLDQLDGIGPGLAQKILDYRTAHGGFRSIDELAEVPGIGEKRLESLRAQLTP